MANGVEDKDLGWRKILENLEYLDEHAVKVGVQGKEALQAKDERTEAGVEAGKGNLLIVASTHEFGSPKKKIPERSYIRSTSDEQRKTIDRAISNIVEEAEKGASEAELRRLLNALGVFVQDKIQAKIVALQVPPLKEATKRRKARTIVGKTKTDAFVAGSGNPLVDTFQLGGSITFAIVKERS